MNQNKKKKMLREALLFVCFGVALSIGLVTHVMHEARTRARVSVELAGVVAMSATAATLVVIVAAVCLGVATRN